MSQGKVFEMRAINDLTKDEFIITSIEDWRKYANQIMDDVEKVKFKQIKLLCYFSIIDSIAQDIVNYSSNKQQEIFTDFILKYQKGYDYLKLVDPITLFYHFEEELKDQLSLNDLIDGRIYNFNDGIIRQLYNRIYRILVNKNGKDQVNKNIKKHRYVDLLYRLRCKVSHEFSSDHTTKVDKFFKPYYINCNRTYLNVDRIIEDNVWELVFPIKFIKELCLNCINNYLDDCQKQKNLPLQNDVLNRMSRLSWYEK